MFTFLSACGERQGFEETPLPEQRQHGLAIFNWKKDKTSQHKRQRFGGWETTSRPGTYMDNYSILPGTSSIKLSS